jgi:glycosyltransferase involved in cell wall biosynthesis
VIDNASTDNTSQEALKYPGVRVVRENTKGLTRARQCGYRNAKGELLAYIDADTRMPEGWVSKTLLAFERDTRLACLSGPYVYYDIPDRDSVVVRIWNSIAVIMSKVIGYAVTGGNFVIKRQILDKMKGFDTTIEFYGEDTNIARRAHQFGIVRFKKDFFMYTSGRRFKDQGLLKTGSLYLRNFFSEVLYHKPADQEYKDYR